MNALPSIVVRNSQRARGIDTKQLQRFAACALPLCLHSNDGVGPNKLVELAEVCVVLVSDARMAALHKEFMNIEGPTDVLTFHDGDIFISVDTAAENASRFGTSMDDELRLYIVHGLLHLRGYDDVDKMAARRMSSVQRRIVAAASETP